MLADDGEKFGGWPGTKDWVYGQRWLDQFTDTIGELIQGGEVQLSRLDDALAQVPANGLAYLPTASYREMEAWSLPPDAALRLARLERDLGEGRIAGPDGALVRGSHWRNFLVKYPESNRMQKKMQALSQLLPPPRQSGEGRGALIARAQCNDAYWHGVFGGLYLPHLRDAIWRNLARAEAELRRGKGLEWEVADYDWDGREEVLIYSEAFSAVVSPFRGGALEEFTLFRERVNYANTLTRRREAYHDLALERTAESGGHGDGGTASIHDIEQGLRLASRPPIDREERALFVDRILPRALTLRAVRRRRLPAHHLLGSDSRRRSRWFVAAGRVEVICRMLIGRAEMVKRYRFDRSGALRVSYTWDPALASAGRLVRAGDLDREPPGPRRASRRRSCGASPIETVAKSERGFDRTRQGES